MTELINGTYYEELDMPTPCVHCGNIFDLHNGYGSKKWYSREQIIICPTCYEEEQKEIERDEEIETCLEIISAAEWDLEDAKKRLEAVNYNPKVDNHAN